MASPKSSAQPGITIPVKVVVDRSRLAPTTPAHQATPPKAVKTPAPAPRPKRQSITQAPIDQRRRWMWGVVAIGMFLAVVLWGLSLGAELRQNSDRPNLIADISALFKSFRFQDQPRDPKQEEIRQFEEQVFPQFK